MNIGVHGCPFVVLNGLFKNDRLEGVNLLLRHATGQKELLDLDGQRLARFAILVEAEAERIREEMRKLTEEI